MDNNISIESDEKKIYLTKNFSAKKGRNIQLLLAYKYNVIILLKKFVLIWENYDFVHYWPPPVSFKKLSLYSILTILFIETC